MKNKIILTLFAIIIFFMPVQNGLFPQEADAFVSKLMGLSAKKMAKEVAKDLAVESAANYALNEAFKIADAQMAKYNQEEAYKIVCLYQTTGEVCDKPIAIKENLTEADKISIAHQAEIELDKLVSPEGKGFTKWQKFLDWFGPVWITSAIMTVITYAIDSDVRNLFNEAGYNALVALGLIKPVTDNDSVKPIQEENTDMSPTTSVPESYSVAVTNQTSKQANLRVDNVINKSLVNAPWVLEYQNNAVGTPGTATNLQLDLMNYSSPYPDNTINLTSFFNITQNYFILNNDLHYGARENMTLTVAKNGEVIYTGSPIVETGDQIRWGGGTHAPIIANLNYENSSKIRAVRTRTPYKIGEFYYTDVLVFTVDGNTIHYQAKTPNFRIAKDVTTTTIFYSTFNPTQQSQAKVILSYNKNPQQKILPPNYEETQQQAPQSSYEDDKGNIALVPPSAIPMTQPSTGQKVTIQPNPVPGGEPVLTNENGDPVPEDDIELGDPVITPSPEGVPTVTPQPSPSNPSPQPQPLTPTPPATTPTDPPPQTPIETEPPKFPEGESCEVGLKIPKIKPLTTAVTTAFPFSIPYDLYQGFQALFSEIGNEKPVFKYKVNFLGDVQEWEIAIPDYFDSWKVFTDSLLIFVFDVGLIYAIYRFMGGGS